MKGKIKNFTRDFLRLSLGRKGYTYFRFILTHRYFPSLKNPRSFNEKIIYRKFEVEPHSLSKYVDKYTVRNYIKSTAGSEYLIRLLKARPVISPDDFDDLPTSFVIKTSNGGGGQNVLVVEDKSALDLNEVCLRFNSYLKIKIGSKLDEYFYDVEKPLILFEELIRNSDSTPLLDYKFHIFKSKGSVKVMLQVNSNYGKVGETKTLYEMNGNKSEIQFAGYVYGSEVIALPQNFQEMKDIAIKLSNTFQYCRVDLYNVDGKIYFGEITLCPASGWDKLNKKKYDYLLGSYWGDGDVVAI